MDFRGLYSQHYMNLWKIWCILWTNAVHDLRETGCRFTRLDRITKTGDVIENISISRVSYYNVINVYLSLFVMDIHREKKTCKSCEYVDSKFKWTWGYFKLVLYEKYVLWNVKLHIICSCRCYRQRNINTLKKIREFK